MSVAIRTATRLQDQDDVNVTPGVGVDEYALTYDHDTAKFVLRAPATPFAGILATGATVGATAQAQVFNYGIKANETRQAVAGLIARSGAWPTPSNILELYDHNNGLRAYMTSSGGLRLAAAGNTGPFAGIDTQGLVVGYFEMGTVANRDLYKSNNSDLSLASSGTTAVSLNCSDGTGSGGMKVGSGTGTTPVFSVSGTGVVTLTAGIRPAADSTTALQLQNAAGTSILNVNTTNSRVGIGTSAPVNTLDVNGYIGCTRIVAYGTQSDILREDGTTIRLYAQAGGAVVTSVSTGESLFSVSLIGLAVQNYFGAATNTVTNLYTINQRSSGTPDAGFGTGILYALNSSTTINQSAARIQTLWYEATHATRKADLVLTAYDTAEREGLRIRGNGSAPAIGFLGATPQARIAHVADPSGGATVDAEARTAINSILSTLELFGLHAAS